MGLGSCRVPFWLFFNDAFLQQTVKKVLQRDLTAIVLNAFKLEYFIMYVFVAEKVVGIFH